MSNLNTELYDSIVDRAAMTRLYEKRISDKVSVILDSHQVKLAELVEKGELTPAARKRLQRAIDIQLSKTYKGLSDVSKKSLLDLASNQISFAYQNIESKVGRIWRTQRPNRRVSEDLVLKRPLYKNNTLENGWKGIENNERKRISQLIRRGISKGQNSKEIALDIRKGRATKMSRAQSLSLVATATTSVYAQADHEVYDANKDALRGWQYIATLDTRTTKICIHRDGKIYNVGEVDFLPPAHWQCRSTTVPIVKHWNDLTKLENLAYVRQRNLAGLTEKQKAYYDGLVPSKETYSQWLFRQPTPVQIRHLGSQNAVDTFNSGKFEVNKFTNVNGQSIGIRDLARLTAQKYTPDTVKRKFDSAREELDQMNLGASTPDDLLGDSELAANLTKYYKLQAGDLSGTLSLTNYRGITIQGKKTRQTGVLKSPPQESQMIFNPVTRRYEDSRIYQPAPHVLNNNLRLVKETDVLKQADKDFITDINTRLAGTLGVNQRAVIVDNLRIVFTRYRKNPEPWINFKAVLNSQIKFDVMNVSDSIETALRSQSDALKRLKLDNYLDPVLGATQLDDLADGLVSNIKAKNKWESRVAPKIALELRNVFDRRIPRKLYKRMTERDLQQFYLKFANRLSLADSPDRDAFAVSLGRDLYNLANYNGSKREWYTLGMRLLESKNVSKFFKLETFGVQKQRLKNSLSGRYFGPYYDTFAYTLRIVDPRIQEYAKVTRKVEVGLRVGVVSKSQRLYFRKGYKTYFVREAPGIYYDTRIPITSTRSFSNFPDSFIDGEFVDALNWAAQAEYKIDTDFYDFMMRLLYFKDDKGKAAYYDDLNGYRTYMASRGDTYERFKAMEWLRGNGKAFANHPFIDHRARIYDRGLIGPQSGEAFRPFLNTAKEGILGINGYKNLNDQIGAFLGGLSDTLEGKFNSLTIKGRQAIAAKYHPEMVKIGNKMLNGKPQDVREILTNRLVLEIDPEEQAKFFRFAIEIAKIDNYLIENRGDLSSLNQYRTALALEQDASSSGAQIIALTTRNRQLAELSNVVNTDQKRRLYDEIAAETFNDPRFKEINKRLGLSEKDLRKAAKAQNMVTLYGAGQKTGALNVEGKLAKILDVDSNVLVVRAADRDKVLDQISGRAARYKKFDPDTYTELMNLRKQVKDLFDKGMSPGDELMEELYFLSPDTREVLEKMTKNYERVVTPQDFHNIAKIMSGHLAERVPILQNFTKYLGRLSNAFIENSKPSNSAMDWVSIAKIKLTGERGKRYTLPPLVTRALGLKPGEPVSEAFFKKINGWTPNGTLANLLLGTDSPTTRRTGKTYLKVEPFDIPVSGGIEVFKANKLPKSWTSAPWVNFDGKVLEQSFSKKYQTRLTYRDKDGNWIVNILDVPDRTEATWWEQFINKSGTISEVADLAKAKTAYAVNGNHSNDAVIVKKFHQWGRKAKKFTSTIHDAFFTNVGDMLEARRALKKIYAETMEINVIEETLKEMKRRGLPNNVYHQYRNEAIELGLIPIAGRSKVAGKTLTKEDILTVDDVLEEVSDEFDGNYYWYGVG